MSLLSWSYVAMLVFCLVGTLPLVPVFGLRVLRQPGRLLLTVALAGTPFLLWDLGATEAGQAALENSGIRPEQIGLFINASVTRDNYEPAVAVGIHERLGLPSSEKNGTNAARPRARCSRWVSTTGSASPKRSSSHVNSGVAMSRASGSRCLAPSKRCTSACGARRMRSSR